MTLKELFGIPFDHVKDVYLVYHYFIYKVDIDTLFCFDKDNNPIEDNHEDIVYGNIDVPVEFITDLEPNCWTREQRDIFHISYKKLTLLLQLSTYKHFTDLFENKSTIILLYDIFERSIPVKEDKFLNWLESIK